MEDSTPTTPTGELPATPTVMNAILESPSIVKRRRTNSLSGPVKRQEVINELQSVSEPNGAISPLVPPQWQRTIERAVKAIVSIRFSQVAAFDTEGSCRTIVEFRQLSGKVASINPDPCSFLGV